MRSQKVLLIQPPYKGNFRVHDRIPVGLGHIEQILIDDHFDCRFLDMGLGHNEKRLREVLKSFAPDLVGVSMMSYRYLDTYRIIKLIKQLRENVRIVVGGPHISALREEALRECPEIDYGVVCEGEYTMVDLCKGLPINEIKGLIFRDREEIMYNGDRSFIEDLDELPFPRYTHFEIERYKTTVDGRPVMDILTSRGCPYECIFCASKAVWRRRWRARGSIKVIEEILYWYEKGFRDFEIVDDNFNFDPRRCYEFCDLIEQSDLKDIRLYCGNGVRADRLNLDLLKRMKEVGFKFLAISPEGGNDRILRLMRKRSKIERIEEIIGNACSLGYQVYLNFVIGVPGETREDVQDAIKLAMRYPVENVNFWNLFPYPGTELYDWVSQNHRFLIRPEVYLNTEGMFSRQPLYTTPEQTMEERLYRINLCIQAEKEVRRRFFERKYSQYQYWIRKPVVKLFINNKLGYRIFWAVRCHPIFVRLTRTALWRRLRQHLNPVAKSV